MVHAQTGSLRETGRRLGVDRQHVADKTIAVHFVGTEGMLADIFTKALDRVAYDRGARRLGLSESSSRGGVDERAETTQAGVQI